MYLSYPKVYRTVTLIYQTVLGEEQAGPQQTDNILHVVFLLIVPCIVLDLL